MTVKQGSINKGFPRESIRTKEQVQRALMRADELHEEGKTLKEISAILGVSDDTLRRWRGRYGDIGVSKQLATLNVGNQAKLTPDARTIRLIRNLASIQCTQEDAAHVLDVHHSTFNDFLQKHPTAAAAWERGFGCGRVSLRRKQWEIADKHAGMAVWLGKQYLNQKDPDRQTSNNYTNNQNVAISVEQTATSGLSTLLGRVREYKKEQIEKGGLGT
jgi:transposase